MRRNHKNFKDRQNVNFAEKTRQDSSSSDSDYGLVVVSHALSSVTNIEKSKWIVDSGATCHMCNNKNLFLELRNLEEVHEIKVGDGYSVEAKGEGTIELQVMLDDAVNSCKLYNVLYIPDLSFNLLSVSKTVKAGKTVKFSQNGCQIVNKNSNIVAAAKKVSNLYYLNCVDSKEVVAHAAASKHVNEKRSDEEIWCRRYGHLGTDNLKKLAQDNLVNGFKYDVSSRNECCEPCAEGKHHRQKFPKAGGRPATEILELVHTDVCGKMNTKSLSGGEYFLTFVDDKSRHTWSYILKQKSEVFDKFIQWKTMVENISGRKIKTLRSDNGGKYTSKEFVEYFKREGMRHEFTIPKTPEQNGVAERMNRTLEECVRSMLSESNLPKSFWAESKLPLT